jgi:hypothetical protein
MATKRTYSTCKAIRGSIVGHRGIILIGDLNMSVNCLYSITCMLRTKVVSLLAMGAKVVLVLHDNPKRRIVVIIQLLK